MPLPPGAGHLLVQRTSDLDTAIGALQIRVGGRVVARLQHGEETWVPLHPGRHTLTTGRRPEDCLPIHVEVTAGTTSAFALTLSSPLWLPGSSMLRPAPPMWKLTPVP